MDHSRPSKSKPKDTMIKYLRRATTFSISTRPYCPPVHDRTFSGPIVPLIPVEARQRRTRSNGRFFDVDQEPTSPKVSCVGQIKHKKAMRRLKANPKSSSSSSSSSSVLSFFLRNKKSRVNSKETAPSQRPVSVQVPSIGQMKRFTSGRDKFDGFVSDFSDDEHETNNRNRRFGEEKEEEDVKQEEQETGQHSGLGLEQRKEVNLWKKRMMVPPRPLQLE